MEGLKVSQTTEDAQEKRTYQSVPMHVVGGNSSLEEADVVFVGTDNHYDQGFQDRIADTLYVLPQQGDEVLTEGEPLGAMRSSWVPEMAKVDTSKVGLSGWEDASLYKQAGTIVNDLSRDIATYNELGGMGLTAIAMVYVAALKKRIEAKMQDFDRVVLHKRSSAMKQAVFGALGRRLTDGGTVFVYAGSAHLTRSELSGMQNVKHTVLGV